MMHYTVNDAYIGGLEAKGRTENNAKEGENAHGEADDVREGEEGLLDERDP